MVCEGLGEGEGEIVDATVMDTSALLKIRFAFPTEMTMRLCAPGVIE